MVATIYSTAGGRRVLKRWLLTAGLAALATAGMPERADAGIWQGAVAGLDRQAKGEAGAGEGTASRSCDERRQRNRRRGRIFGAVLGGIAGMVGGGSDDRAALVGLLVPAGALLGDAIAGLLDCDEQRKAATATEDALRGGVGTTTTWTSTTRPGVSGSSTVIAAAPTADGGECMTLTDVVIVDGEETRAPKRMCRVPPSLRYARV